MLGTFGGALEARHIDASNGRLTGEITGEVETEDDVLVIRRIHVEMRLVAPEEARPVVERVHEIYLTALSTLSNIQQNASALVFDYAGATNGLTGGL